MRIFLTHSQLEITVGVCRSYLAVQLKQLFGHQDRSIIIPNFPSTSGHLRRVETNRKTISSIPNKKQTKTLAEANRAAFLLSIGDIFFVKLFICKIFSTKSDLQVKIHPSYLVHEFYIVFIFS